MSLSRHGRTLTLALYALPIKSAAAEPSDDMSFDHNRLIIGYHGCDREVAYNVLMGNDRLKPSANAFDWLGQGIYFWEYGPHRALEFAKEQADRGVVKIPDVLGAYIHLGHCFDLTDREATTRLKEFHPVWRKKLEDEGIPVPKNRKTGKVAEDMLLRELDCAVLNTLHRILDDGAGGKLYFHTVRGVFVEGAPVYAGSGIHEKTHVQIAVRDPSLILGYFRPNL